VCYTVDGQKRMAHRAPARASSRTNRHKPGNPKGSSANAACGSWCSIASSCVNQCIFATSCDLPTFLTCSFVQIALLVFFDALVLAYEYFSVTSGQTPFQ
jgi:hypothetical protein